MVDSETEPDASLPAATLVDPRSADLFNDH